jgi:carboxypeptidase Taq
VTAAFDELRRRLAEVNDLARASAVLSWDQRTMMPPRGGEVRAEALATLGRVAHERFTSPEIGRLLDELAPFEEAHPYDSFEASLIRVTRRDWLKACKVPPELRSEMSRSASLADAVWVRARLENDFASFLPALRESLELRRRYIACFDGDYDEPYDAVLDDFERGMRTAEVRSIFDYLKEHQTPLLRAVADAEPLPAPPERAFPLERQQQLQLEVLRAFGFDDDAWRLDPTVHPFASGAGTQDIRLTTRYHERSLDGLFATMHECGHGLYEHQIDPQLERTPLCRGTSLGMHESQSRLWENLVGRSRAFWHCFFPRAQELFPDALHGYDADRWYREVNAVEPSLIRVEADEATYNFHIILRFELEQELLAEAFPLEQLPEEWNRRMWEYLRVEVPDDTRGVLQDVHWSSGSIGYFPTSALGNLISAQLWERAARDLPALDGDFERGSFGPLREWLREHLHRHGRKFTPSETLELVAGTPTIDPQPYVRYLRRKLGDIYGLRLDDAPPRAEVR